MKADGVGSLFGPGMVEGPFPEHYEPLEGPLAKQPLSGQLKNPTMTVFKSDLDKVANADEKFPFVCTTSSCTEHWCSGFTRWQPWLLEMQPEALYHTEFGSVALKPHKCIGCKACIPACPFGVPKLNAETNKISKCDLRSTRLQAGQPPACVLSCPTGVLTIGGMENLKILHNYGGSSLE